MSSDDTAINFVEMVQQSKVKQPTQLGFSKKTWNKLFNERISPSEDEKRIHDAGLWFFDRLAEVRNKLQEYPVNFLEALLLRRAYVALVNRDFKVINNAAFKNAAALSDKTLYSGEMAEKKLPIGPGGYPTHLIGAIESIVTTIRYPVSETFNLSKTLLKKEPPKDLEILDIIAKRVQLGVTYDEYSVLWAECLWNEWKVKKSARKDVVEPKISQEYISQVISEHRGNNLILEMTLYSIMFWKRMPKTIKDQLLRCLFEAKIIERNRTKEIRFTPFKETEFPPLTFIATICAEERYWNELLQYPLQNLKELTIREILKCWEILSSLGKALEKRLPENTEVKKLDKLLEYAPTISISDLIKSLRKTVDLSLDKIYSLIDLFTFSGKVRDDPWFKPLIQISDKEYTVIIPALVVPNLIRSIEYWMKVGGIDLDQRGEDFENFTRLEINKSLKDSKYLKNSIVIDKPIEIRLNNQMEEIDLIWIIGKTIILGEIKCSIYPTSPMEKHNYFNILCGATVQAKRKLKFIQENFEEICSKLDIHKQDVLNFNFYPIVITNIAARVGFPIDGVPITDLTVVRKYIEGTQKFFVNISSQGEGEHATKKTLFSSETEAKDNIFSYLLNPPQFRILRKLIQKEETPLFPVVKNDKIYTTTRLLINETLLERRND